jgi:nucleotide-binding universal stress UspA family protein
MADDLYRILFPVDFSNRCELAARHVKTWAQKLSAVLDTLHVVDPEELGYSDEQDYNVISDLAVRRTADLKYFSDQYLGENVAQHTVVTGDARVQIESFAKQEKADLIMLPRTHQSIGSRLLRDSLTGTILERIAASLWITEHSLFTASKHRGLTFLGACVQRQRGLLLSGRLYRRLSK